MLESVIPERKEKKFGEPGAGWETLAGEKGKGNLGNGKRTLRLPIKAPGKGSFQLL